MKKLSNYETELKKALLTKKACQSSLAKISVFPFLITMGFLADKYVSRSQIEHFAHSVYN